jgi:CBS-domain-containing membrane protein
MKRYPSSPRRNLRAELALALLPTLTMLIVLFGVEVFSRQRLLFASLASSAFLIYLDPTHRTNSTKTLVMSQILAGLIGYGAGHFLGPGYFAAATAMILAIGMMIGLDVLHPPAVSTALGFAFRTGPESNLLLFALAVGLIAILVILQRATTYLAARYGKTD